MSEPAPDSMTAKDFVAWQASQERKRHKYGARPVVIDGIRFDSTAEGTRYWELRRLERAGEITALELQPVYPLVVQGVRIGAYVGDFRYRDAASRIVVEDVKGIRTAMYRWKKKHVKAQYGIDIREVSG